MNGHIPTITNKNQLGIWCTAIRDKYRKNELDEDKIKKCFLKNKRIPSSTSKNITERRLGVWRVSRQQDY